MKLSQYYPGRREIFVGIICLLTLFFSMPVFSQDPVADFKADQTTGCQGLVVIFTDKSVDAEKWEWTFEGGLPESASTQGPHQVTYQNPGNFDVTLEVEGNNSSDKEVKLEYIQISDCSPTANFSVSPTSGCSPLTVTYTDQSVDATTWNWSFPGGSPSSALSKGPHAVTYSGAASYSATLVVANQYGQDTKTKNNAVNVSRCFDFGDAPYPYPTTLQQNGARHTYDASLFLGQGVDKEADGQPDSTATGDDTHGSNDEDGVELLQELVPGDTTRISVTASLGGYLKAWIDFNQDGDWEDEGEEVVDEQVGEGANELEIFVPEDAVEGPTYARFRYSDEMIPSFDGEVNGGEVEDMRFYLENFHFYDYGDAPDNDSLHYQTLREHNGARHPVSDKIYLGTAYHEGEATIPPDLEGNGNPSSTATGDDFTGIDDECGVAPMQLFSPGKSTAIRIHFHGNGTLHGWFDWNQDGDWHDADEYAIYYNNTEGDIFKELVVDLPEYVELGALFARYRYTTDPFSFSYGRGGSGEVEDYMHHVQAIYYDYGDAPESYGTLKPNGACHSQHHYVRLGELCEPDSNGHPTENALGDDLSGGDDEDGVVFYPSTSGEEYTIVVYAIGVDAFLHAWIDFNQDGDFDDSGEKIIEESGRFDRGYTYHVEIPEDAIEGLTYARFRFTRDPAPGPRGPSDYPGEVEDYTIRIGEMRFDYGDAPYPFHTLLQEDGARHLLDSTVYLGSGVSADEDGKSDSLATGDDDDGVIFPDGVWMPGDTVEVTVTASTNGYLSIWYAPAPAETDNISKINISEDFPYKQTRIELTKGENTVEIITEDSIFSPGIGYLRFRFSTQPIDNPDGIAFDGEVEDYLFECMQELKYEYGDAPEGAIAYPHTGQIGAFPTCEDCEYDSYIWGLAKFIRHGTLGLSPYNYFGPSADIEYEGNGGFCPDFYPDEYDQDETWNDGDAGLIGPTVYIIEGEGGSIRLTPTKTSEHSRLYTCHEMHWGEDIDIAYTVNSEEGAYINVLFDWNQDGWWNEGWAGCAPHGTYEHVVKNFHVPEGTGKLGDHEISRFFSGDNHGYVWVRFSITNEEVELNVADHWNGSGIFSDGETEDYLLFFNDGDAREFGDAPDSALAYPATGQTGYFPTCKKSWGWDSPGYISHTVYGDHGVRLGRQNSIITHELNGNHGFCSCTEFHHFNKDIDNGLRKVKAYTITGPEGSETIGDDYFWDPTPALASLGMPCQKARWGTNIDLAWCNTTNPVETVYINVLMDWNQDGRWGGSISCSDSTLCEEHVLKNLEIDIGGSQESIAGFMSSSEREFNIGPNSGYVWARFTITKEPVELPWVGTGNFEDGETEDYLLYITSYMPPMDYGDAMPPFNTLLQEDGARHVIDSGVYLGSGVSSDEDGRPDSLAAGDDDDGITFESPWMIGDTGIIVVTHSVAGYLGIWYAPCDSQGSVSPLQAKMKLGEMNGNSQSDTLFIKVDNSKFTWGDYMLRFRFSTDSSFSHYGLAPDGEVEDYMITISPSTEVETGNSQVIPREYVLKQNVPNPFNPETMIEYNLPVRSRIRLVIFDVLGHQIREWEIASQEAGSNTIVWDGRDRNNTQVAAGIYIYHIEVISIGSDDKPFQATQKMIFLK